MRLLMPVYEDAPGNSGVLPRSDETAGQTTAELP
jgi:hypothetical protein